MTNTKLDEKRPGLIHFKYCIVPSYHRHLREIDRSLAVVGRPAAESGANQYSCPAYNAKVCEMVAAVAGNIITSAHKGRRAGPMRGLLLLDV